MSKGKYEKWLEPDSLILLKAWARDGLTDEQISQKMGIAVSTLYDWKNKYSEFSEALKKGKEVVDIEVENALYKLAIDGNITAIIFWLKNRKPNMWRDKPTTDNIEILNKLDGLLQGLKDNADYTDRKTE